jgi:predicted DNA binding protein
MYIEQIDFTHECPNMKFLRKAQNFCNCDLIILGSSGISKRKGLFYESVSSIISLKEEDKKAIHEILREMMRNEEIKNVEISFKSKELCGVRYDLRATEMRMMFPECGHILYPVKVTPEVERWMIIFPNKSKRDKFYSAIDDRSVEIFGRRSINHELIVEIFENLDLISSSLRIPKELTDIQKEVLKTAYHEGFFEVPKKVTVRELAEKRGISESAVIRTIKRGERKILSRILRHI